MLDNKAVDHIENHRDAVIQHGPLSKRIYLMHLGESNPEEMTAFLHKMAVEQGYTKIFAKLPKNRADAFLRNGYRIEAAIPLFYRFRDDAVFLGSYLSSERSELKQPEQIAAYLRLAESYASRPPILLSLPKKAHIRVCTSEDAEEVSALYKSVFKTYPFPIDDPGYIRYTMQSHVLYFSVELSGRLIALSSAEMNQPSGNVEMTDFATDPAWRGHGLAVCLLARMEQEMVQRNIITAYTIARAISPSMNISFSKMGYHYGGTLVNNTNIAGRIESMNVWYKYLV